METVKKIILCFFLQSCLHQLTCEESLKGYEDEVIPPLIVRKVRSNGNELHLIGTDLSGGDLTYGSIGDWSYDIGELFQVGDTVVKKKGEAIFRVYRKGERWQFKYICEKNERGEDIVRSENTRF